MNNNSIMREWSTRKFKLKNSWDSHKTNDKNHIPDSVKLREYLARLIPTNKMHRKTNLTDKRENNLVFRHTDLKLQWIFSSQIMKEKNQWNAILNIVKNKNRQSKFCFQQTYPLRVKQKPVAGKEWWEWFEKEDLSCVERLK